MIYDILSNKFIKLYAEGLVKSQQYNRKFKYLVKTGRQIGISFRTNQWANW